ncbi:ABC transporter permease [[Mycoplasma] gypis]|uniref:ABC transporter permease n=1 Tax=[Mycoplasma] gypis TaxID=92404 RepID=A0ABZ2RNH0_9BACT|nr:ABC transporter permease [[Mycoplasma] gypis]MBN0919402.1 ABC transporter permease [[Mycoplasma] gypis]
MTNSIKKATESMRSFSSKASEFIKMGQTKSSARKVASSIWAIIFGIAISSIFIASLGVNPSVFFKALIDGAFAEYNKNKLILYFSIFLIGSLGVGLGFKSGYFNIGIPGQMLAAGTTSFSILIATKNFRNISGGLLVGLMLLSILVGAFLGMFAGFMKAYFGVHEVISTILLNWIVIYVTTYVFKIDNAVFYNLEESRKFLLDTNDGTKTIRLAKELQEIFTYFALAFGIATVLVLWFIFAKTSLGYKIKMVGMSKTNAEYIGTNQKVVTMSILTISGGLAGLAGFLYYVILNRNVVDYSNPLSLGFDTIAISLLALNAPVGIVFTSMFYAVLKQGSFNLWTVNVNTENMSMVTGLIILFAALSVLFLHFKPIYFVKKTILLIKDSEWRQTFKDYVISRKEIIASSNQKIAEAKKHKKSVKKQYKELTKLHKKEVDELLKQNIKNYSSEQKNEYFLRLSSLNRDYKQKVEQIQYFEYKNQKLMKEGILSTKRKEFFTYSNKRYEVLNHKLWLDIKNTSPKTKKIFKNVALASLLLIGFVFVVVGKVVLSTPTLALPGLAIFGLIIILLALIMLVWINIFPTERKENK